MNQRINVGIIGFGLSGSIFHAPILASIPAFNLAKIYTTNPDNIKTAEEKYPEAVVVSAIQDITKDEKIDMVIVASPNISHYAIAKEAILLGKHVIIEKPFTVTSAEADELITLAHINGTLLSVYHNRRWDSDFKTVQKVIQDKRLGKLVECEIHFDRFRNAIKANTWKEEDTAGSGILYDLGSHLIDQAQVLFGIPTEITADLKIQRAESNIIDNFSVMLNYPGLKVTLKAGMLVKACLPRYILLGNQGAFIKYGLDIQEADLKAGCNPLTKAAWGEEPEEIYGKLDVLENGIDKIETVKSEIGNYREYYINIYNAIMGKEAVAVTPEQARNNIRLIELAIESSCKRCSLRIDRYGEWIK